LRSKIIAIGVCSAAAALAVAALPIAFYEGRSYYRDFISDVLAHAELVGRAAIPARAERSGRSLAGSHPAGFASRRGGHGPVHRQGQLLATYTADSQRPWSFRCCRRATATSSAGTRSRSSGASSTRTVLGTIYVRANFEPASATLEYAGLAGGRADRRDGRGLAGVASAAGERHPHFLAELAHRARRAAPGAVPPRPRRAARPHAHEGDHLRPVDHRPRGRFTDDQPAWRAFTGQTESECQGVRLAQRFLPEDRDRTDAAAHALESRSNLEVAARLGMRRLRGTATCAFGLSLGRWRGCRSRVDRVGDGHRESPAHRGGVAAPQRRARSARRRPHGPAPRRQPRSRELHLLRLARPANAPHRDHRAAHSSPRAR
jgi:hypothetical protein